MPLTDDKEIDKLFYILEKRLNSKGYVALENFLALSDTPDAYSGAANKAVRVNSAANSLIFDFVSAPMKDIRDYVPTGGKSYLEMAVTGIGASSITLGVSTPQTLLASSFTEVVGTASDGVRAYSIPANIALFVAKGGVITIPAPGEVVGGITITKHILKIYGAFSSG
jgi:hypothetical protein